MTDDDKNTYKGCFNPDVMKQWDQRTPGKYEIGDSIEDSVTIFRLNEDKTQLSSLFGDRLLVLNFGSYSCRPFRVGTNSLLEVYEKWKDRVDFATIYIQEAHPTDQWYMYLEIDYEQPKIIQKRIEIANKYRDELKYPIPLFIDNMDNEIDLIFGAWPQRIYVIHNNIILYKGELGPRGYIPSEVDQFLSKHFDY